MNRLTPDDFGYALECNEALQQLIADRRYRCVINGHTHRRMVRAFDSVTIINVGTLFRDHDPCVAIVNFESRFVDFFDIASSGIAPADRHRL